MVGVMTVSAMDGRAACVLVGVTTVDCGRNGEVTNALPLIAWARRSDAVIDGRLTAGRGLVFTFGMASNSWPAVGGSP